jgi:predicted small lipoprotein YifL
MRAWIAVCLGVVAAVAGCGSAGPAPQPPAAATPSPPSRSELARRQDAACEALGPRLTECAIADAKASMTKTELVELDLPHTAPRHTAEFIEKCRKQELSSRQVRVYEGCLHQETQCEALLACLDHVKPQAAS